ncbi:MAG: NAD(+) synthase [Clostridiales bacterium]|nr:NAD(+) synthase [Clostridiales bacterium]
MNLGYVRCASYTPEIKVADVNYNLGEIKKGIDKAKECAVHILSFPELCLTGYTAGDLFYQKTLLLSVKKAIIEIADFTKGKNLLVFIGAPIEKDSLVYNCSVAISDGVILGIVPKSYLPDYDAFNEKRYFSSGDDKISYVNLKEIESEGLIPFSRNIIFADGKNDWLKVGVEICEDLWTAVPPSLYHALNGARIIVNHSASPEFSGRCEVRRNLVKSHSEKAVCAYIYSNAGNGESTTDCVFSGHSMICENGEILNESQPFTSGLIYADIDLEILNYNRSKIFNQKFDIKEKEYFTVGFSLDIEDFASDRVYDKTPFIKKGEEEFLITAQASGLIKRITHVNANTVVLGLSGGLDSTLALIVAVKAMKMLNRPLKDILAITMPCFGTSLRTLDNSIALAKSYGVSLKKVDITKSVKRHLKDIGHSENLHDAAYENAQARERTQVLMDIANMCNGLVIGTGDLSELALGWATYNGDHMSMYAVNGSVPKTLVRHLVNYTANTNKGKLKAVLLDILDTPVSPELIPSEDKKIKQVTEDIVGPYILHDYFLYSMIKKGFSPKKIYYTAVNTFKGEFTDETILKWLKTFVRRFFNQQFKRSCMPDGVKVTEISLSPRTGYKMPSDAVSKLWLDELENL